MVSLLNMFDLMDPNFNSIGATRIRRSGSYVNGEWVAGAPVLTTHTISLQEATNEDVDNISMGGKRITDHRVIHVFDGDLNSISPADDWQFTTGEGVDGLYETVSVDNRPWLNYTRVVVSRKDDQ